MENTCPVCGNHLETKDGTCPSCGFKLSGSTEEFQPITLGAEETAPVPTASKTVQVANLKVIRGPQIGTAYKLDDKQLYIGRSPQCDIFLNDMTVSRDHALIYPKNGCFFIRDRQSFNGIWINNESIEEAKLNDGDIIQIGAFCLKFEG